MLSVSPQLSDSVMAAAMAIETPALVYDLETLDQAVEDFRTDLLPVTDATLCFAVKANRAPDVLARLAAQGVGGDVATLAELHAARAASLSPIFATSPAFTEIEWRELKQAGILPDLDSRSQVARWARHPDLGRRIGLRIRLRLPDDRYDVSPFGRWSRFGVDADDPQLHQLLREHDLEVVQLHAHAGEVGSLEQADRLMETMLTCLELFPRVETLNLGGGFAPLYHKHAAGSKAW